MVRVLTFALVTTALAGCAARAGSAADRTADPGCRRRRARGAAGAQGAVWRLTASIAPEWTPASAPATISTDLPTAPGPRTRPFRPTSRTMARSRRSRTRASSASAISSMRRRTIPTAASAWLIRAFSTRRRSRRKGLTPIQPWLDQIRGLKSRTGYAPSRREAARNGVAGLFAGGVGQDDRHSDVYITGLGQAGLGMPDRDMYLLNDAKLRLASRGLCRPSDQDADAGRRDECRRRGPRRSWLSRPTSRRSRGTAKTSATRPRPITR